jgi:hypothetical protein
VRALAIVLLALAGCGRAGSADQATSSDPHDGRIECRIGSATEFERFCTIEQSDGEDGRTLTIRKPDGGFRRLLVTGDGRGVVPADGAEAARVTIIADNRIEVEIGGDTFRLPATVQSR